jgi:hypothetical protein
MAIDPKVKNLIRFFVINVGGSAAAIFFAIRCTFCACGIHGNSLMTVYGCYFGRVWSEESVYGYRLHSCLCGRLESLSAYVQVGVHILLTEYIAQLIFYVYRRLVLPPKAPRQYGKWAIVTGTTSGIWLCTVKY